MKIIDLLNKIANGEEDDLLTEFEFDKRIWNFKGLNDSEFCLDGWLLNQNITITKHKEIIEEDKEIEEIKINLNSTRPFTDQIEDKLNEIIRNHNKIMRNFNELKKGK